MENTFGSPPGSQRSVSSQDSPQKKQTEPTFVSMRHISSNNGSDTLSSKENISPLPKQSTMTLTQRAKLHRFVSSQRLPQFFVESNEQQMRNERIQKEREEEYMRIKADLGLA